MENWEKKENGSVDLEKGAKSKDLSNASSDPLKGLYENVEDSVFVCVCV